MSSDDRLLTEADLKRMAALAEDVRLMLIRADEQLLEMNECLREMRALEAEIEQMENEGEEWKGGGA